MQKLLQKEQEREASPETRHEALAALELQEPLVIVVLSERGLEKAFVLWETPEALKRGNVLLAQVSEQLVGLDAAITGGAGVNP